MTDTAPDFTDVSDLLQVLMRNDRGRLIAALIARLGNFQLAEDALQDAMASALQHWSRNGPPSAPHGWLLRAAYRKAVDRLRKDSSEARKISNLRPLLDDWAEIERDDIADERLRLIFTCCHPALEQKSQMALTLRTICGLTTREIAALFLDSEAAMGQRITRAKTKIAKAGIAYAVPDAAEWPQRVQSVLAVIYLVFTADYVSSETATRDLADEALFLARMLNQLRPADAEIEGCLALISITRARRDARVGEAGITVPLDTQDRRLWDMDLANAGQELLDRALARNMPGPYQIKAAIAALHARDNPPDWRQIVLLYDSLLRFEPTAIVRLHRAVALAEAGWLAGAIEALVWLEPDLREYQPYYAAKAALLARDDQVEAAATAYRQAIAMTTNPADAAFLSHRLRSLDTQ